MKGTVVLCLRELVLSRSGEAAWGQLLDAAGVARETLFLPLADVPDETVDRLARAACDATGLSLPKLLEAFGEYWLSTFTRNGYRQHFAGVSSSRAFLERLTDIHAAASRTLSNAQPPRFTLEWRDPRRLYLHYESSRGLVDVAVGAARGVGRHFGEDLEVRKLSPRTLEIVFR